MALDVIIIGIDPGIRNAGISAVRFEEDKKIVEQAHYLTSKVGTPDEEVLHMISSKLREVLDGYKGRFVGLAIEAVFFGWNISSAMRTAKVIGICQYTSWHYDLQCIELAPTAVKKLIGLKGNVKKELVGKRVEELTNSKFRNDHVSDSVAIAIAAHNQAQDGENKSDRLIGMNRGLNSSKTLGSV